MVSFDEFLDYTIPFLVVVIGGYLLYRPLREPLSGLVNGIKRLIGWGRDKTGEEIVGRQIAYE